MMVAGIVGSCRLVEAKQVSDAKVFCESLIPAIEKDRGRSRQYPASPDPAWWKGKTVPKLIDLRYLYKTSLTDPNSFTLKFENPHAFWANVVMFSSDNLAWHSFDSNLGHAGETATYPYAGPPE
jgi:hypothetical protein